MEESRLRTLRRKQLLYTNLLFLVNLLIVFALIAFQAAAPVVYTVLGLIFLIPPLSLQIMKRPNPLLFYLPGMKELFQYEMDKLGSNWRRYYTSSSILLVALSVFFFVQAVMQDGNKLFMEGMPVWYLVVIPLALIYIGNMNLRFHARRLDEKTPEQLKAYAYDKMLFSLVFASVSVVMTVLGAIVVMLMT
ncbi:hypothetical protein ACFO25_07500 [Paenactinomyces guangxiensis]|uniref:Uncharacterized protein n=1 Tax=Paenactinomyces guangxiensis TaxID=1490290 RepID=A0A7W1WND5_9BACL|nr:hypothetical protein [Paenactinomyces guangxiensis]MBA4493107.1 hypothetical protein [Paenactinomyces guangxiensis]MBH8590043.1 hypothetical protein [Paenactinomyces guangxiensis]